MTRSKDAGDRRAVLKALGVIRDSTARMTRRWTVSGSVWDFDAPRDEHGNIPSRWRRLDEYPENSQEEWNALSRTIEDQIIALRLLQNFAKEQASRPKFTADDPEFPSR